MLKLPFYLKMEEAISSESLVNSTGLYGIISQDAVLFVVTSVRFSTSNKLVSFLSSELHFSFPAGL
jgi:hypothetical protein